MHLHTFTLDVPRSTRVFCSGCDGEFRLATRDEAHYIIMTDMFYDGGPLNGPNNVVVVPLNFSLYQEV